MAVTFDELYSYLKRRPETASLPDSYLAAEYERITGNKAVLSNPAYRDNPLGDPGVMTDIGRGIGRGWGSFETGLGGGLRAVEDVTGLGLGSKAMYDYGQARIERNQPAASVAGDVYSANKGVNWDLLKRPDYWAQAGAEAITSSAPALAAGLATQNPFVFGALAGGQEAAPNYYQMREQGLGKGEALAKAGAETVAIGALNALPFANAIGAMGVKRLVPRLVTTATGEAVTEWMEEPTQAAIEGRDIGQAARQGVNVMPGSFISGLLMGGLGNGTAAQQQQAPAPAPAPAGLGQPVDTLPDLRQAYPDPASTPQLEGPPGSIRPPAPDFVVDPYGRAAAPGQALPDDRRLPAPPATGQYEVAPDGTVRPLGTNELADLKQQRAERANLGLGQTERTAWNVERARPPSFNDWNTREGNPNYLLHIADQGNAKGILKDGIKAGNDGYVYLWDGHLDAQSNEIMNEARQTRGMTWEQAQATPNSYMAVNRSAIKDRIEADPYTGETRVKGDISPSALTEVQDAVTEAAGRGLGAVGERVQPYALRPHEPGTAEFRTGPEGHRAVVRQTNDGRFEAVTPEGDSLGIFDGPHIAARAVQRDLAQRGVGESARSYGGQQIMERAKQYGELQPAQQAGVPANPLAGNVRQTGVEGAQGRLSRALERATKPLHEMVGSVQNPRWEAKLRNGKSVVFGRISFDDWKTRAQENLPGKDLAAARAWYGDLNQIMAQIFGPENADRYSLAWLLTQKRASPAAGLQNILRAVDEVRGLPVIKRGGLNHRQLVEVLRGQVPADGYGAKLLDFIDSEMRRPTLAAMGDDPRGGQPAVVDVWGNRDVGKVDQTTYDWLKKEFGSAAVAGLKVDGKNITETDYEFGSRFYNELSNSLNAENFDGGNWRPLETQAVGWVATQRLMGAEAQFPSDMVSLNTRRVSIGLSPGAGTELAGGPEISEPVARQIITEAAKRAGVMIRGISVGPGAYLGDPETSIHVDILGSPESMADFADIVGYALRQTEVLISRRLKSGATRGFTLTPTNGNPFATQGEAEKFMSAIRARLGDKHHIADGYQVINEGGKTSIRILHGVENVKQKKVVWRGKWRENEVSAFTLALAAEAKSRGLDIDAAWSNYDVHSERNDWAANPDGKGYRESLLARGRRLLESQLGAPEFQVSQGGQARAAPAPDTQAEAAGQVAEPTHAYSAQDESQSSFQFETRPDTNPEQVRKGNAFIGNLIAFRDRMAGASELANQLTRDFVERGFTAIVGSTARSGRDLAALAQVYRDPRVETLRLFAMRGNQIVGQTAIRQRMPGAVSFGSDGDFSRWSAFLKSHNADGYYLQHNHPSGTARASDGDVGFTGRAQAAMPGFKFKGHVIIDHNEYGVIDGKGSAKVVSRDFRGYDPKTNPKTPSPWLGESITGPTSLARIGSRIGSEPGMVTVIATNTAGKVSAVTAFPKDTFAVPEVDGSKSARLKFWQAVARVRRLRASSGSGGYVFAVTDDSTALRQAALDGVFTDVVDTDVGRAMGEHWRNELNYQGQNASTEAHNAVRFMGRSTVGEVADRAAPYGDPAPTAGLNERGKVETGGGEYSVDAFGDPAETAAMVDLLQSFTDRIAQQRGGAGKRTWSEVDRRNAGRNWGALINQMADRKPGQIAGDVKTEAMGQVVAKVYADFRTAIAKYQQTHSLEDQAEMLRQRERFGLLAAPYFANLTELGRGLAIARKVKAQMQDGNALFETMGGSGEEAALEFARQAGQAQTPEQLMKLTAATYKPSLWDQFYEFWINGLLSGPWTHAVNITSNALFTALELGTEYATAAVTPGMDTRVVHARWSGMMAGRALAATNALRAFQTETPQLGAQRQVEQGRYQAIPGQAGRIIRIPGRALMWADEANKAIVYTGDLYAQAMERALAANPANPQSVFQQQLAAISQDEAAKARAIQTAERLAFQTPLGELGTSMKRVLDKSKFGRLIVPFVKTPTNILKRALEYTPAAAAMKQVREDYQAGGARKAMVLGRVAIGSTIMGTMMAAVAQGLATGAGPDDPKERELWMRTGRKPYSFRVGDTWYRYNRFEPVGMLLGVAADVAEIGKAMPTKDAETIGTMIVNSIALNLGDKTFLRGVIDFTQAYSDPKRFGKEWISGMAGTAIPNIAAQGARALDPLVRDARSMTDKFVARIPGARESLPAKLDVAGEPIERSLVEPVAATDARNDPLAETMLSLGVHKGSPGRTLQLASRRYELTPEEYADFKQFTQQTRWRVLTPRVQSPQFQALARAQPLAAADYLERAWDDIGRKTRDAWLLRRREVVGKILTQKQ